MSRSYAELTISASAFDEIVAKFQADPKWAGAVQVRVPGRAPEIDMHGVGLLRSLDPFTTEFGRFHAQLRAFQKFEPELLEREGVFGATPEQIAINWAEFSAERVRWFFRADEATRRCVWDLMEKDER